MSWQRGARVTRHRDVTGLPDESLLCIIRGGHAWHLESDYDSQDWGQIPIGKLKGQARARVFNWRCTCTRTKRQVWDREDGDLLTSPTYDGGHLLMVGTARVAEARTEWISRIVARGGSGAIAERILRAVNDDE